jgi:hypothetical protein
MSTFMLYQISICRNRATGVTEASCYCATREYKLLTWTDYETHYSNGEKLFGSWSRSRIHPLLGSDSVTYTAQRLCNNRGHPLLDNGCVFCARTRSYITRSLTVQLEAQSRQKWRVSSRRERFVKCCNKLYKGPINSNPKPVL